jgi:hypothetical protein
VRQWEALESEKQAGPRVWSPPAQGNWKPPEALQKGKSGCLQWPSGSCPSFPSLASLLSSLPQPHCLLLLFHKLDTKAILTDLEPFPLFPPPKMFSFRHPCGPLPYLFQSLLSDILKTLNDVFPMTEFFLIVKSDLLAKQKLPPEG